MEGSKSMSTASVVRQSLAWPVVVAIQVALVSLIGTALALRWRPSPHSDWHYYWSAAGNPADYERGGLTLWLLAIPKSLGIPPEIAALVLNLPAVIALGWLAYRADGGRWKIHAQALMAYLLLITPFMGIVQLDVAAAAQLAIGLWLALNHDIALPARVRQLLALAAIVFAVSTKPQYALILWTMTGLAAIAWMLFCRRRSDALPILFGLLLVGSMIGFATDMGMRHVSGRTQQIRTSSAVTLYGGLLVSSEQRAERCGYWSEKAAEAAKQDLGKPLADAVFDRLRAQPIGHWLSVIRCKIPEIVRPVPYALYWLIESPNVRTAINASPRHASIDAAYEKALKWERRMYRLVTAFILLMVLWVTVHLWRRLPGMAMLPMLWVLSFWLVHAAFEIQGRYFLGMFVIAPLLCALSYRQAGAWPNRNGASRPDSVGGSIPGSS